MVARSFIIRANTRLCIINKSNQCKYTRWKLSQIFFFLQHVCSHLIDKENAHEKFDCEILWYILNTILSLFITMYNLKKTIESWIQSFLSLWFYEPNLDFYKVCLKNVQYHRNSFLATRLYLLICEGEITRRIKLSTKGWESSIQSQICLETMTKMNRPIKSFSIIYLLWTKTENIKSDLLVQSKVRNSEVS